MLAALEKEEGEFVRPALDPRAGGDSEGSEGHDVLMRDAMRGVDFFRSTVIEAIGDYKVATAMPRLVEIAKLEGPLQDDAATAIGKIGDKTQLGTLAADAAVGAEGNAAGDCRGDLPDGHELFRAHRLSREDAHVCRHLSRLPGSAARRRRRTRQHRAPGQRGRAAHPVRRRHSVAGSGARAGRRWPSAWSRCATRR